MTVATVLHQGVPYAVLAEGRDFGLQTRTLLGLPTRAFTEAELKASHPLFLPYVDVRRTTPLQLPSEVAVARAGVSWLASTRKAQTSLLAWFLLAEDPHRRLEVLDVAPLMHQRSLVEHILNAADLRRVLIADEVGLGKTVESGLILQRLLQTTPSAKALYLAPARLVRNVVAELSRLGLDARRWTAFDSDARLDRDRLVVASIQKSVRDGNASALAAAGPWDIIVADECHHLSDWAEGGGSPNAGYRLVDRLIAAQRPDVGRVLLLSGTPHQGHQARFENLLALLRHPGEAAADVAGRVIFRTKEMVSDWNGQPLFPGRDVRPPTVVGLGRDWSNWYNDVAMLYDGAADGFAGRRAGGWAKGQALQWVASSVNAGLGFLARLAIRRLRWGVDHPDLAAALAALRPYRRGNSEEPLEMLLSRLQRQMNMVDEDEDAEETSNDDEGSWTPDPRLLGRLLREGVVLKGARADAEKWDSMARLLHGADGEKVVLFCQPVETVEVVVTEIERAFGQRPCVIIGGQTDAERDAEVAAFRSRQGPRFLVSSRAGGEGINLQVARRLIHLDVPWNPMDLEQRVGRVHRFGSRETILVDTIVVAGTREADAYRIAREKLHRIVSNLAPGEFEALFGRVMSLVAPEELAGVLSSSLPWPTGGDVETRIADIVSAGFNRWSEFTERFKENERQISSVRPGAAQWHDFREFLTRACAATDGPDATRPVFSVDGRGVGSRFAEVRTVTAFGQPFVCDETDGLPAEDERGRPIARIGTAHPEVVAAIRARAAELPDDRVGSIKLRSNKLPGWPPPGSTVILIYAAQRIELVAGSAEERELTLEIYTVAEGERPRHVQGDTIGELVRQICAAERQTTPESQILTQALVDFDRENLQLIRTLDQNSGDVVPIVGVWPVACFVAKVT